MTLSYALGLMIAAAGAAVLLPFALLRLGDWMHAKTQKTDTVAPPYEPGLLPHPGRIPGARNLGH